MKTYQITRDSQPFTVVEVSHKAAILAFYHLGFRDVTFDEVKEIKSMKTQATIQSAAIYRVTDKVTGEKFFLVKSDSCKNCYHEVRWDSERLAWTCNGEHCQYQRGGTNCKHARACSQVMQARRAAAVRLQAIEERVVANLASAARPIDERGSLNGQRGFQLMR